MKMNSMATDAELIAQHIAKHGVKHCQTVDLRTWHLNPLYKIKELNLTFLRKPTTQEVIENEL